MTAPSPLRIVATPSMVAARAEQRRIDVAWRAAVLRAAGYDEETPRKDVR